jgi:hypothetical protein
MPPKGKVKAPEAPTSLLVGPTDGSQHIDFRPFIDAIQSNDIKKHNSVAETLNVLPQVDSIQVRRSGMDGGGRSQATAQSSK